MKEHTFDSLGGLKGRVSVPETVAEYDSLAKREGACLDDAVSNTLYRGVLADFRASVCEIVEERHGVARKREPHPDGKTTADGQPVMVVTEPELKYILRAAGELGVEVTSFQDIADEVSNTLEFDPSQRERKARSAVPGKGDLELADTMLAAGGDKLATNLARIGKVIGRTLPDSIDRVALGLAIKEYRVKIVNQLTV